MKKPNSIPLQSMASREEIEGWMRNLQESTCRQLEGADGVAKFKEDLWERPGGGGGRTRVLSDGNLLEKAGVNFSAVYGETTEKMAKSLDLPREDFFATGVSSVLHPVNPHVPIIHMNVRYFQMGDEYWWFGGGIDLTPHYIDKIEAREFHKTLRGICDRHSPNYYSQFSAWAEKYFYIPHRNETRGIGGIFFDRLGSEKGTKEKLFDFVKEIGLAYAPLWLKLADSKRDKEFNQEQKDWQLLRRGRYVEFNLVYDKGTKFGLETNGRTESILMSLPPFAKWEYDHQMPEGSPERETAELLKNSQNWLE